MHATFSHFVQCFSTQQESCELRPDEVRGSSLLRTAVESRLDVLGEVEVEDDVLQRLVVASGIAVGGDELAPARRAHFALAQHIVACVSASRARVLATRVPLSGPAHRCRCVPAHHARVCELACQHHHGCERLRRACRPLSSTRMARF